MGNRTKKRFAELVPPSYRLGQLHELVETWPNIEIELKRVCPTQRDLSVFAIFF